MGVVGGGVHYLNSCLVKNSATRGHCPESKEAIEKLWCFLFLLKLQLQSI